MFAKALVTGAAGFIGEAVVRALVTPQVDAVQRVIDTVPRATFSERAASLGVRANSRIYEIVTEHLEG